MSSNDSRVPVIVGVGQLRANRDRDVMQTRSPLSLMVEAIGAAATDSGVAGLLTAADSVGVVNVLSWRYDNLPQLVADEIGATPARLDYASIGGNEPARLLDDAAAAIAAGQSRVAVICGAEAVSSLRATLSGGSMPQWSPGEPPQVNIGEIASELMLRYQHALPVRAYPLYENAFRVHLGQTYAESQHESASLYAAFSDRAARQPAAWDPRPRTAADIETVTAKNRMICYPYPLLMNANIAVDQAAAVIVTSVAAARDAGIDERQWIYVRSAAGAADADDIYSRVNYHSSPAMAATLRDTLDRAHLSASDLTAIDLYSCFPIVPKLAARELGLPLSGNLTATGGLTSFGGPGNNYSMHAIAAVAAELRRVGGPGLVYANGGLLTKHHAVVLDSRPPTHEFSGGATTSAVDTDHPPVIEATGGAGAVETYTVEFERDGTPKRGWVVGRTDDGSRFPAVVDDVATLRALTRPDSESIGSRGAIGQAEDGRTTFTLLSAPASD